MFRKKWKNFKAILAILGHSKPKIVSVSQPWWPIFFETLFPSNHFGAAANLSLWYCIVRTKVIMFCLTILTEESKREKFFFQKV